MRDFSNNQSIVNFGDKIYLSIKTAKDRLFFLGEMNFLTGLAYDEYIRWIDSVENDSIPISYPISYRSDSTSLMSKPRNYSKNKLTGIFEDFKSHKLSIYGIYQMVTIIESLLNDLLKLIFLEYPQKIPSKKKIDVGTVFSSETFELVKLNIIESFINEISYKSPKDYAAEFNTYASIDISTIPSYNQYVELKATRDIYIHNDGISNDVYIAKAGDLARVSSNKWLPVTNQYFMQMYEQCLQLTEELEKKFDGIWESEMYRNRTGLAIPNSTSL